MTRVFALRSQDCGRKWVSIAQRMADSGYMRTPAMVRNRVLRCEKGLKMGEVPWTNLEVE